MDDAMVRAFPPTRHSAVAAVRSADAGIEARLRREAQVLARLEHPGIAPTISARCRTGASSTR